MQINYKKYQSRVRSAMHRITTLTGQFIKPQCDGWANIPQALAYNPEDFIFIALLCTNI